MSAFSGAGSGAPQLLLGAIVTLTFSHGASADPLPLYQLAMASPAQTAPRLQTAPSQGGVIAERLRRQLVNYATAKRRAPSLSTPPTPIFIWCWVTDRRCATASASAATALPGRACSRSPRSRNGRIGHPGGNDRAPAYLPRYMAGGPGNPLGARAMYLSGTVYRIHGTNAPGTIGTHVSSGCIRLTNEDVADLYSRLTSAPKWLCFRWIVVPTILPAGAVEGATMNHSFYSADRSTHLKIVVAALVAASQAQMIAPHLSYGSTTNRVVTLEVQECQWMPRGAIRTRPVWLVSNECSSQRSFGRRAGGIRTHTGRSLRANGQRPIRPGRARNPAGASRPPAISRF